MSFDASELSSCTSNNEIQRSYTSTFMIMLIAQGPSTTCLGPKADEQFPHLWCSTLTDSWFELISSFCNVLHSQKIGPKNWGHFVWSLTALKATVVLYDLVLISYMMLSVISYNWHLYHMDILAHNTVTLIIMKRLWKSHMIQLHLYVPIYEQIRLSVIAGDHVITPCCHWREAIVIYEGWLWASDKWPCSCSCLFGWCFTALSAQQGKTVKRNKI